MLSIHFACFVMKYTKVILILLHTIPIHTPLHVFQQSLVDVDFVCIYVPVLRE